MNDYESTQRKHNMIVGVFVIIGTVIFIYLVFRFGDLPTAVTKFTSFSIKARFPSAPGVQKNTPVQYCGYHIGKVIYVAPPAPFKDENGLFAHLVTVNMAISRNYSSIPANVSIELIKRGLGSSYIELKSEPMKAEDFNKLEPKYLRDGMLLQGKSGSESEFLPISVRNKIEELFDKATRVLDNVNTIIGDSQNQANLKAALANLSKATEESIETLNQIKKFSSEGRETMRQANAKISSVSDSVLKTSEELGGAMTELRRVLYKINNGQGTVGKLINDNRLYENLLDSTEELRMSLEKMKKTFEKTSKKGIQVSVF